jgi:hypothetical protein
MKLVSCYRPKSQGAIGLQAATKKFMYSDQTFPTLAFCLTHVMHGQSVQLFLPNDTEWWVVPRAFSSLCSADSVDLISSS